MEYSEKTDYSQRVYFPIQLKADFELRLMAEEDSWHIWKIDVGDADVIGTLQSNGEHDYLLYPLRR